MKEGHTDKHLASRMAWDLLLSCICMAVFGLLLGLRDFCHPVTRSTGSVVGRYLLK